MMFCPKCGSLMLPKKGKKGILACSCGYVEKESKDFKIKENIKKEDDIDVVYTEIDPSPLIEAQCPKCSHNKARFWTVQTRASDEPETKFMKCEKCKHIWRDYN
ncbi:MAG: transcription factor S [Nanoarchaeota archaeon]